MTTITIQFEHHALKLSKLPTDDDLEIEIEAKGKFDLRTLAGKISVQHAMIDRIAELEAQLAAVGAGGVTAGQTLMTFADDAERRALAADGDLFRRTVQAMVTEDPRFIERMDALVEGRPGEEPPTLDEVRATLREALA